MPKGVYPHNSPKQKAQMLAAMAKGRKPEARAKAADSLRENAKSEEWRQFVSEQTKKAIQQIPGMKEKLKKRGGNGQGVVSVVLQAYEALKEFGFVMECLVVTTHYQGQHRATAAHHYKIDLGHPIRKIGIEYDGPYHRETTQKIKDRKKDEILEALGWIVVRIPYSDKDVVT